ncbi:pumilio homolog 24-like [Musa acuminata AAA Group]|uniref:pumilio homolog 24-like n=1 Tax=Musa acuminata AAA Group TaxID=214697 RepID=UPI0031DE67CC
MDALHKAIASLAALPKTNKSQEEHVLENFHSSRLIRKLVLGFVATLWKMALDGKCDVWAQGHRGLEANNLLRLLPNLRFPRKLKSRRMTMVSIVNH